MLPESYEVPLLIAEMAKNLLYFKKTGNHIDADTVNPDYFIQRRCADVFGNRFCTLNYQNEGIGYTDHPDSKIRSHIFLSAFKKSRAFIPFQ